MRLRIAVAVLLTLLTGSAFAQSAASPEQQQKPKVRTITAFVHMERQKYRAQVASALEFLRAAKTEFTLAGFEVETIRITTQPFTEYTKGLTPQQTIEFFKQYDELAKKEGFTPDIGPAMVRDSDAPGQADLLGQILAATETINGFVTVADQDGIHWNGIRAAARVNKYLEEHTARSEGNFRFAAGAFPPQHAPFYPVSFAQGTGQEFAIGLESANIVNEVFNRAPEDLSAAGRQLTVALGAEAKKVEEIALRVEKDKGWKYQGIDLTPVPLKEISIGAAFEALLKNPIGSPGSLSTAFTITSAVRNVPVHQTGYSGLMLPVMEDSVLAKRWEAGAITRDTLMSYSSVCSTGLDAVPLPGDISQHDLENIIADMASLAVKWRKPLSARLLPVAGKRAGDMTEFSSPYLVNIRIR